MKIILIGLCLGILFMGKRLFVIYRYFSGSNNISGIQLHLPWTFYIEKAVYLSLLVLFLYALSPVPALYAVAVVIGIFLDLFISIFYYSVREQLKDESEMAAG